MFLRCVHIAFRLARCSFCAELRTRPASHASFSPRYGSSPSPPFLPKLPRRGTRRRVAEIRITWNGISGKGYRGRNLATFTKDRGWGERRVTDRTINNKRRVLSRDIEKDGRRGNGTVFLRFPLPVFPTVERRNPLVGR